MNFPDQLPEDPLALFRAWYDETSSLDDRVRSAMTLATVSPSGRPSARIVLYKGLFDGGFRFFTNYESRKGSELAQNPYASLVFYWDSLYRQVRIEGRADKISREESNKYFASRPRESQLGAWASAQSREITNRSVMDKKFSELSREYGANVIPCPPFWGGYRLVPDRMEFWQGRDQRLHDRACYLKDGPGWKKIILSS